MDSPSDKDDCSLDFLPKDQAEKLKKMHRPGYFTPQVVRHFRKFNLAERLLARPPAVDVPTSPLMQVLSITLHKYQDDGTPSQIYGMITIDDGEGPSFPIYNRTSYEPQRVCCGDRLMLSVPEGSGAIIPSNKVDIVITLFSRIHKDDDDDDDQMEGIVDTTYRWDFKMFREYDIPIELKINGAHGYVVVEYVVYRHAVYVTVDAKLLKKEEDDHRVNFAQVYGTISAHCGKNSSTYLFEKVESEAVMVEYGSNIELSSSVMVIPVWAQFVIEAKLWSRNPTKIIANGIADDFQPIEFGRQSQLIEGEDGIIKAEVRWRPAHQIPTGTDTHNLFPVVKKMRIAPDQQALQAETINRNLQSNLRKSLEQKVFPQFEVFSISVHNSDKKELSVWGSVVGQNIKSSNRFLFKKDKTGAERLVHNQTIPIMFPLQCMKGAEFNISVDLKDEDDCVVSYGRFCWLPLDPKAPLTSYGRKLCSVLQGDNGYYTALYCSIFDGGLQAVVKIHLIDKSSTVKYAKVYGCVRSQYSTFKYLTADDNEYYTRKLYVRHNEDGVLKLTQSKTLLSELVVSVPVCCALIVDVDLNVNFPTADSTKDIVARSGQHVGQAIFSTERVIETWFSDETHGLQIEVSVEWKACPLK